MEKRIIARGLLAGAIGGVLAFLFARIFVEPVIDRAIAYEDAAAAAHDHGGHEHGVELITRGVQANVGLGFGVIGFAVAMGALFAVAYCVAYGRVGNISGHGQGFVSIALLFGVERGHRGAPAGELGHCGAADPGSRPGHKRDQAVEFATSTVRDHAAKR